MTRQRTYWLVPPLAFVFLFLLISCTKNENKINAQNPPQKYTINKIALGYSSADAGKSAKTLEEKGVRWLGGEVTIDDTGKIYVLARASILMFNTDGTFIKEIIVGDMRKNVADYQRIGPIEVSADGTTIYIRLEKGNNAKYHLYNVNGDLLSSKEEAGFIRKISSGLFHTEKYGVVKHEIITTEMYVLNQELNVIKNLNDFYMTNIRLNERPPGFFDAGLNFYYVSYIPPITKQDLNGKIIWQKNVDFQGQNWQLIGIDKDANLYALVSTGNHISIVKMDKEVNVLSVISLEELQKDTTVLEGIQEDRDWVRSFRVNSDGIIYYIANKGIVYKFEQSKQQ